MGCCVAGPKAWWAARPTWAGVAQAGGERGKEGRRIGPVGWAGPPWERKEDGEVQGEGKGGEHTERVL